MESVEELCDHIALINQGKCILQGSVDEVKSAYRSHTYQLQFEGELKAVNDFEIISQKENNAVFQALNGKDSNHLLQQLLLKLKLSLSKSNYRASTISSSKKSVNNEQHLTHHTKRILIKSA